MFQYRQCIVNNFGDKEHLSLDEQKDLEKLFKNSSSTLLTNNFHNDFEKVKIHDNFLSYHALFQAFENHFGTKTSGTTGTIYKSRIEKSPFFENKIIKNYLEKQFPGSYILMGIEIKLTNDEEYFVKIFRNIKEFQSEIEEFDKPTFKEYISFIDEYQKTNPGIKLPILIYPLYHGSLKDTKGSLRGTKNPDIGYTIMKKASGKALEYYLNDIEKNPIDSHKFDILKEMMSQIARQSFHLDYAFYTKFKEGGTVLKHFDGHVDNFYYDENNGKFYWIDLSVLFASLTTTPYINAKSERLMDIMSREYIGKQLNPANYISLNFFELQNTVNDIIQHKNRILIWKPLYEQYISTLRKSLEITNDNYLMQAFEITKQLILGIAETTEFKLFEQLNVITTEISSNKFIV